MSTHILKRLSEPVRALVLATVKNAGSSSIYGASERDGSQVHEWIEKASDPSLAAESNLKALDFYLISRTFLVSNYLTVADVVMYAALHPIIFNEIPSQYYTHLSLTRYFDHIQTRPQIRAAADSLNPPFNLVAIDIENGPKPTRIVEPSKRREKTTKIDGTAAAAANEASAPVPSMIDLRVGHIIDVKRHPDADGLYVEQINLGEETGPRTVVSGLVNYIPIEQMKDKLLVVVCNLKPANMRGIKSYAMVLCATHKDGKNAGIEIVDPPKNAKPGERVYFEGFEDDKPIDQLNPKKKIFETIQPGFTTLETKEAAWIDSVTKSVHRIRTKEGVCTAPSFVGASLS